MPRSWRTSAQKRTSRVGERLRSSARRLAASFGLFLALACRQVLSAFALTFRAVARQLATAWARRQASDAEPVALARAPAPLEPVLRGALAVQQGRSYLRRLPRDLAALGRLEEVSRQLRSLAPEEPSFPRAAECLKSR